MKKDNENVFEGEIVKVAQRYLEKLDILQKAFNQGFDDYYAGCSYDDQPQYADPDERNAWDVGWDYASEILKNLNPINTLEIQ